jgi:hypothetical protein
LTCRSRYGTQVVVSSWIAVFCLFGIRASFALLKDPLAQAMNWSQAKVTFGYSFMMIVYALTAFLCGIIVDRKGSRPVYAIAAIASLAGLMATGLMRSFAVYILSFSIMTGIATGMLWDHIGTKMVYRQAVCKQMGLGICRGSGIAVRPDLHCKAYPDGRPGHHLEACLHRPFPDFRFYAPYSLFSGKKRARILWL